jgi:hypothetical protein
MERLVQSRRKYVRFVKDGDTEEDQFVPKATIEPDQEPKSKTCYRIGLFSMMLVESTLLFVLLIYVIMVTHVPSDIECARQLSPWCRITYASMLKYRGLY